MNYSFDELCDRRNTNSLKWDVKQNELPMWVADMDFKTAPEIISAIKETTDRGIFGYSIIPQEWNHAYAEWWKKRHDFEIKEDSLVFCTGVVPAISSAVRKLTTPGENVLLLTPVYNIFFNSILNNGRNVLECPLVYNQNAQTSKEAYAIDFRLFEEHLSNPQTALLILCNPHNPVGRIWTKEELEHIGSLCATYNVTVLSDEIHCDLTDPTLEYIPFASVNETCKNISITCLAPTKAFNIAGLQSAAIMAENPFLKHKMWRALNTDEVAEPNAFAVNATIAAFTRGETFLDELRKYIYQNKKITTAFAKEWLPQLKLVPSDATYLLWFDCSSISKDSEILCKQIRKKTGLYLSDGKEYGKGGESFFRMNIACPKERLYDGLERLKNFFN